MPAVQKCIYESIRWEMYLHFNAYQQIHTNLKQTGLHSGHTKTNKQTAGTKSYWYPGPKNIYYENLLNSNLKVIDFLCAFQEYLPSFSALDETATTNTGRTSANGRFAIASCVSTLWEFFKKQVIINLWKKILLLFSVHAFVYPIPITSLTQLVMMLIMILVTPYLPLVLGKNQKVSYLLVMVSLA